MTSMSTTVTIVNSPPRRIKLNLNSVIAGFPIFISGGMSLALGLGWNLRTHVPTTLHFQLCWFIGVIAGAVLAAPLVPFLLKRYYLLASATLIMVGGIIFVSVPYEYDAIIAARYINGIAVGFATVPFLVHNGEVGCRVFRGTLLSYEQFGITVGVAAQVIYSALWTYATDFSANRLHGIVAVFCGLLVLGPALGTIESPIYHVRRGDDAAALECLRRLNWQPVITPVTRALLRGQKNYVVGNELHSTVLGSLRQSLRPLVIMLFFRAIVALSFSLPLSAAMQLSSFIAFNRVSNVLPVCSAVLRLLFAFVATLLMRFTRKMAPLISLIGMASLTIAISFNFAKNSSSLKVNQMLATGILTVVLQPIAGLYVPSASAYLGEAFPLLVKPYCIAACIAAEQIVHIIVICTYTINNVEETYVYCVSSGVIMIWFFLIFYVMLPETRLTSLSEANGQFKRWLHMGFNGRKTQ